jgi:hypothetical protein
MVSAARCALNMMSRTRIIHAGEKKTSDKMPLSLRELLWRHIVEVSRQEVGIGLMFQGHTGTYDTSNFFQ